MVYIFDRITITKQYFGNLYENINLEWNLYSYLYDNLYHENENLTWNLETALKINAYGE
jgi:hypothetical protein